MSKEEVIKILQHYLEMEEFNNAGDFLIAIEKILDLYNKEKETSHFLQSQLDEANAKLIEEKEKNKELFEEYQKRVSKIIMYEQTIKEAIDEFTDVLED